MDYGPPRETTVGFDVEYLIRVCESSMQKQPHPFVSAETGDAPFGTIPRRPSAPLNIWIGAYVLWLLALCAMAWMRFFAA